MKPSAQRTDNGDAVRLPERISADPAGAASTPPRAGTMSPRRRRAQPWASLLSPVALLAALSTSPAQAGASSGSAVAAAPGPAVAPRTAVPDTLAQRALPCSSCHQAEDRETTADGYIPRIAGKPAGYLLAQLKAFRDGRRSHIGMAHLLAPLDDAYLAELAAHFAALPSAPYRPPATPLDPESEGRASAWVLRGDAARGVPACTACHGERLTGVAPAVPGLLGLPAAYVSAQLGAWRQGLRRARHPDCMAQIAQALPLEDVPAIARWLAARPLPADNRPDLVPAPPRGSSGSMPMPCGSIPP